MGAQALLGTSDMRGEHRLGGDLGMVEQAIGRTRFAPTPTGGGILAVGFSPNVSNPFPARRFRRLSPRSILANSAANALIPSPPTPSNKPLLPDARRAPCAATRHGGTALPLSPHSFEFVPFGYVGDEFHPLRRSVYSIGDIRRCQDMGNGMYRRWRWIERLANRRKARRFSALRAKRIKKRKSPKHLNHPITYCPAARHPRTKESPPGANPPAKPWGK